MGLFGRAAESLKTEGPGGFSKRAAKYVIRLGRHEDDARPPMIETHMSPEHGTFAPVTQEELARVPALYGPVREGVVNVEKLLLSLSPKDFPFLAGVLDHVLEAGGKRVRTALALLGGRTGRYELELLVPLAASIELLHTATLVHDDVIDAAPTRRGRETANAKFDNTISVMVGDYMFAHAAELVARTGNIDVVRLFAATLMRMATGELHQDVSAYAYGSSIIEYFNRIGGKTASLFATAAQGGAMVGGASTEVALALRDYGENIGMAFQIVDDILDFSASDEELGKPAGSDLMNGTLTLPSLLLIERHPDDNPVERYFDMREDEDAPEDLTQNKDLQRALQMIRESDILDESYKVATDFRDRGLRALEALPAGDAKAVFTEIAYFVTQRRS
jgi:geranylgeranyl pyrophosphate synthase